MIDAEAEYEGHYAAAQTYIADLRAKVGAAYPLGLASFPYVSYHPSFPYSVFLGPNGAQYNAPQMYWKDIGISVDTVYANTYIANRIYGRPIFPLGQTYGERQRAELLRFREEAVDYGATGLVLLGLAGNPDSRLERARRAAGAADERHAEHHLPRTGATAAKGDQVLWMQEHLASAIPSQETTGIFDATTAANLEAVPDRPRHRAAAASPKPRDLGRRCWRSRPSRSTGPAGRAERLKDGRPSRPAPARGSSDPLDQRARCRGRRRSTSSRSRSPCRSARARAAAS